MTTDEKKNVQDEFEAQNAAYSQMPRGLFDPITARKAYEAQYLDNQDKPAVVDAPEAAPTLQPRKNPYEDQYNEGLNDYLGRLADAVEPPLSMEERQRREKSAHSIAGINALGRVAGAFGNLLYTPKGAGALGSSKGVDIPKMSKDFNDEQRDLANRYIAAAGQRLAAVQARKKDWDATEAMRIESERKMQELELKMKQAERQGKLDEAKLLKEQYQGEKARYDALVSQVKAEYAPKQQEADLGTKYARTNASNASANASNARANKTQMESHKTIVAGDKSYRIPLDKYNEANLSSIITYMGGDPEAVKRTVKFVGGVEDSSSETKESMKLAAMATWIGKNIRGNARGEEAMERLVSGKGMPGHKDTAPGVGGNKMPGVK